MTIPTAAETNLLRTMSHRTRLHLFLYTPPIMLAAKSTGNLEPGDTIITYNNVSSGSYLDVVAGMTLYIGTAPGGHDLGRIRIRSIVSGQITVAENNDIRWTSGLYLSVGKFLEPWGVYPSVVLDSNNVPIFYKDGNIVYTNQNNILDPVPMMGPNMPGLIDQQTGLCSIYFDGSASYDVNDAGLISAYSWQFEGAAILTSTLATPGYISWSQPGDYLVRLTVTNNQGKSFTAYRIVMIRTKYAGTNPPIRNWGMDNLTGNYTSGGWSGRFWMRQPAGAQIVRPGALVMILAEDWYGNTKQSIGGNYPKREGLLFTGYVRDGSVSIDPVTSVVEFEIVNLSLKLDISEVFSVSLVSKTLPATWYEMAFMNVDKAIQHFIRWHTTLYQIADVRRNGDILPVQYADFSREPLRGCLDNFISSTLMGKMITDRQGQVWFEKNVNIIQVEERTLGTALNLIRKDWKDLVSITQRRDAPTSYVELGGISYGGPVSDAFVAYISSAPGVAPKYTGQTSVINGMVLLTQERTNQLVGNVLAMMNNEFPNVKIDFAGNYRLFDLAPQQRIKATLLPDENNLQLYWNAKSLIPRTVQIQYDRSQELLLVSLDCEAETDGPPGVTGPYPIAPPDDVVDFDTTPLDIPSPPEIPGPDTIPASGGTVYVATTTHIARTRNFLDASPNWLDITGVISGAIKDFILDPWDPKNKAYLTTDTGIYRTEDLDDTATWDLVLTKAAAAALVGLAPTVDDSFLRIIANITQENLVYANFYSDVTVSLYILKSIDAGATWTFKSMGAGASAFNGQNMKAMAVGQHNPNVIFQASRSPSHPFNPGVYVSNNGNLSYTLQHDFISCCYIYDLHTPYAANPLDQVVYCIFNANNAVSSVLYRSLDQGVTWTNISPVGFNFANVHPFKIHSYTQDRNVMFCSNGTQLWFSLDAGTSWELKSTFLDSNAFGGFPSNGGRVYRLEIASGPFTSIDSGVTWENKFGDWGSTVSALFGLGVMIIPVWIE